MKREAPEADPAPAGAGRWGRWAGRLHRVEDGVLVGALALMMSLGLLDLEVWARLGWRWNFSGADNLIRHLTLITGMVGGMVAAREGRLLSLASLAQFLPARLAGGCRVFSGMVGMAVTFYLAVAGWEFVRVEREAGNVLPLGIPVWWTQAFLPVCFGVITARLGWRSGEGWRGRVAALGGAVLAVAAAAWPGAPREVMAVPLLVVLGAATLAGAPLFVLLGGAALILFWRQGDPIASIPLDHYDQVTNPLLATLPLFTLAGYFLAESQASGRLVRFFLAWTGWIRGGAAIVTVLACAFFTTFTGGSGVTILALGGLLLPVLQAARYSEKTAIGLLTGAGALGILFPPCLPLIIYSIVAKVEMNRMFLAGLVPGMVMVILAAAWGVWRGPRLEGEEKTFHWGEAWQATWEAKWELLLPVLPMVLIFGGLALPVPAAAATAVYAFLTQTVAHRELRWGSSLPQTMKECGLLVGGVLLILGPAMGLTNFLITVQVPDQAAAWIGGAIESKWVFLLALNLFLIGVGCLMDIFAAIIVVAPLVAPMAVMFGIPAEQMGVIFLANLQLGYLTPPVGMNLFLSSYRFNRPVLMVARASLPMLGVLAVGVLLITYVPGLTLWLPGLFE